MATAAGTVSPAKFREQALAASTGDTRVNLRELAIELCYGPFQHDPLQQVQLATLLLSVERLDRSSLALMATTVRFLDAPARVAGDYLDSLLLHQQRTPSAVVRLFLGKSIDPTLLSRQMQQGGDLDVSAGRALMHGPVLTASLAGFLESVHRHASPAVQVQMSCLLDQGWDRSLCELYETACALEDSTPVEAISVGELDWHLPLS